MALALQLKRGLKANLPALAAQGEPLFTTDTNELFIGTGSGISKFADVTVGATAPTITFENQLWLNTTTNQLNRYSAGQWVVASGKAATWGNLDGDITTQTDLMTKFADTKTAYELADTTAKTDLASTTAGKGSSLVGFFDNGTFAGAETVTAALVKVKGDVDAEAVRAAAAEDGLQGAITTEANTRSTQDGLLRTDINNLTTSLADETTARSEADGVLQDNLDAETLARETADSTLTTNLGTEAATRLANDNTLQGNIDTLAATVSTLTGGTATSVSELEDHIDAVELALTTEVTRATGAETTLQGNLNTEATTRATNDLTLQGNIDAEATRATGIEAGLQTQITDLDNTKAELAGASTQVFEVADGTINSQAVNLGQLNTGLATKAPKAGDLAQTFKVATPVDANDAATKQYVDNVATGLDVKQSVKVLVDVDTVLSGVKTIDGVSLIAGDRVLVTGQTDATTNGIYAVAEGVWVRAQDADNSPLCEVSSGMFTFVEEGTVYGNSGWVLTADNNTTVAGTPAVALGSTDLTFAQFSGSGTYTAADGVKLEGTIFKLTDTGVGAGTYTKVTVDAKGRVTGAVNPTTIAGYGLTDAAYISGSTTQTFEVAEAVTDAQAINLGQGNDLYLSVSQTLDMGTF